MKLYDKKISGGGGGGGGSNKGAGKGLFSVQMSRSKDHGCMRLPLIAVTQASYLKVGEAIPAGK